MRSIRILLKFPVDPYYVPLSWYMISQSFGKVPKLSDWVNITCKTRATCLADVCIIYVGMSSGPAELASLTRFKTLQEAFNAVVIECDIRHRRIHDLKGPKLQECCYFL